MKNLKLKIVLFALTLLSISVNAQEKKIKFSKGTLTICSSKNFQITGYDGDEVVIKSLHEKKNNGSFATTVINSNGYSYAQNGRRLAKISKNDSVRATQGRVMYFFEDQDRKEGLKKLGKKYENAEYGIYFTIEQKDNELIFKDNRPKNRQFIMYGNERYEIKIPNSLKLKWTTNNCIDEKRRFSGSTVFYNSNPSSLSDFNGEVDIESTLGNIKLTDVTGPVTVNTVGGNVTVEFNKKKPQQLYSIYSNNGFIDVQIPSGSSLSADVEGKAVYSDVDFTILDEKEEKDFGNIKNIMKLKLGSGKVKMKLDANYGNIYLRKK
jgi:hypothetical protein